MNPSEPLLVFVSSYDKKPTELMMRLEENSFLIVLIVL